MKVPGVEDPGKLMKLKKSRQKVSWNLNRSSPGMEQCFQTKVYVMALFTPVEELPDPGINIIKVLSLA